jgi:integrase
MAKKTKKEAGPDDVDGVLKEGLIRKKGIWHYRFMFHGKLVTGSTGCGDRESGRLYLLRVRSAMELEGIDVRRQKKVTFGECYNLWMKAKAPRVAYTTIVNFTSFWRCYWQSWMDVPLQELQPKIDELYSTYKLNHSPASQRGMFVKIKSILNFARERCLHNLPFDILQIKVPKKPKVVMHEEEILTFFHHLDQIANLHQQVMVRSMYWLGLRRFEAYELRWDRYDERNQTYTVEGKGGKVETLPVVEEMAEWFARLPRAGKYMCPGDGQDSIHGDKYTDHVVKQAAAAMGFTSWSHHRLRASLATTLLNKGIPLVQVSAIMRHSSPSTTAQYYYQQDLKNMRAAMERVKPTPSPEPSAKVVPLKVQVV